MSYKMELETDDGNINLELEITHYTPDRPAKLTGHPDSWTPPENGDLGYKVLSARPVMSKDDVVPDWICDVAFGPITDDRQDAIDGILDYVDLQARCLDFDPTESEDEKIIEFLDKQLAEERESANFDRELERAGL